MVVADLKRCGFRRRFENLAALRPPPCPGGGYLAYRHFDVQIRITTRTPPLAGRHDPVPRFLWAWRSGCVFGRQVKMGLKLKGTG